jgi:hypothetical protein
MSLQHGSKPTAPPLAAEAAQSRLGGLIAPLAPSEVYRRHR